jgi:hypothetical protein
VSDSQQGLAALLETYNTVSLAAERHRDSLCCPCWKIVLWYLASSNGIVIAAADLLAVIVWAVSEMRATMSLVIRYETA